MPSIKKSDAPLSTSELPVPEVTFDFDEATNQLTVTSVFDFNYPDGAVINRLGRKPKGGTDADKPITQKTYGKGTRIFTGSADADDNPMFFSARLYAETKEALSEGEDE